MQHCFPGLYNTGRYLFWKYDDENGKMFPWNTNRMCAIMNGRNIMMVGDSLQFQLFMTMVSSVLSQTVVVLNQSPHGAGTGSISETISEQQRKNTFQCDDIFCPPEAEPTSALNESSSGAGGVSGAKTEVEHCDRLTRYVAHFSCGGGFPDYSVVFHKDFHLKHIDTSGEEQNWVRDLRHFNISLLMLNTGAHFVAMNDSADEPDVKYAHLKQTLFGTLSYLYAHIPNISIMYRNTPEGTPYCWKHFNDVPSNVNRFNLSKEELDPLSNGSHRSDFNIYHWGDFAGENKVVENMLRLHFPQVFHIDVATR